MTQTLTIVVSGRVASMKNSRVAVMTKGKPRVIKSAKAQESFLKIKNTAQHYIKDKPIWPLDIRVPFRVDIECVYNNMKHPDIDGVVTTVLDALQGVVYPSDAYCFGVSAVKRVNRTLDNECVIIKITTLGDGGLVSEFKTSN